MWQLKLLTLESDKRCSDLRKELEEKSVAVEEEKIKILEKMQEVSRKKITSNTSKYQQYINITHHLI